MQEGGKFMPPNLDCMFFRGLSTYNYCSALIQLMMELQYKHELWANLIFIIKDNSFNVAGNSSNILETS